MRYIMLELDTFSLSIMNEMQSNGDLPQYQIMIFNVT